MKGTEVNFYSGGGSKLNKTARSYKEIALAAKNIKNFKFVWITDGTGWKTCSICKILKTGKCLIY